MKGKNFNLTPVKHSTRSEHDLSMSKYSTAEFGQLIPIYSEYCMPGDNFTIDFSLATRCMPLVAPIMHEINCTTHWFFVPFRILDDNWETFITGGINGDDESSQITLSASNKTQFQLFDSLLSSLYDLFVNHHNAIQFDVNAWKLMVYNQIYNDYYRDENLIQERDLLDINWAYRAWTKDYFTAGLPFQQRGISPGIPISVNANLNYTNYNNYGGVSLYATGVSTTPFINDLQWLNQSTSPTGTNLTNATLPNQMPALSSGYLGVDSQYWRQWFNGTTVSAEAISDFDIADLRDAWQVQRYMEALARSGVRYTEVLKAIWDVSPTDERLDRPEYIGGSRQPIIISEVLQTSSTDSTSPQGNMAGHGISADQTHIGKYKVYEWGMIMGIMSIMPKPVYYQGFDRRDLTQSRYDYPNPYFMHLSERPTLNRELCVTGTSYDDMPHSYLGIWDEWRVKQDKIGSYLAIPSTSYGLSHWQLARMFSYTSPPALNQQFIELGPTTSQQLKERCFVNPSLPSFVYNAHSSVRAIRPMPFIADPGLVDH